MAPLLLLGACSRPSTGSGPTATADCTLGLRIGSVEYAAAIPWPRSTGRSYQPAEMSECSDVGPSPRGTWYSGRGEHRATARLIGVDPHAAVLAQGPDGSWQVWVSTSLGEDERVGLLSSLRPTG